MAPLTIEQRLAALEAWRDGHVSACNDTLDEYRERHERLEGLEEYRDVHATTIRVLLEANGKHREVFECLLEWIQIHGDSNAKARLIPALKKALNQ
jgi:hypothetical protein